VADNAKVTKTPQTTRPRETVNVECCAPRGEWLQCIVDTSLICLPWEYTRIILA